MHVWERVGVAGQYTEGGFQVQVLRGMVAFGGGNAPPLRQSYPPPPAIGSATASTSF
jgi:hypothetical protein